MDLLCVDSFGEPVLCELKCGFQGYYGGSSARMRGALAAFGNSPMCQHQAQLAVTVELFKKTYGVRPRAYVLLINDATQKAFELRESMASRGALVADAIRR